VIFDRHKVVAISIPRTGSLCIFDILHDLFPGSKGDGNPTGPLKDYLYSEGPAPIEYYKHGHFTYQNWEDFLQGGPSVPQISQAAQQNYNKYKIFSFVRNPYDRMASIFYWERSECNSTYGPCKCHSKEAFTKFCHQSLTDEGFCNGWKTQTEFLQNSRGKISLDFIGKLENFESDWSQLQRQFGFPPYDPKYRESNRSKQRKISSFDELYEEETKSLVFKHFKDDFVNFDYAQ